ncbi:MAG: diguanylate cyclase [Pseudomonadota bacterium]
MTPHPNITRLEARIATLEQRLAESQAAEAGLRRELEDTHREYEGQMLRLNQLVVDGELVEIELMQTFNSSADGMWVIDESYTVQRVNDTLLGLLGMAKKDVIGRKCHELMSGSVCNGAACPMVSVKRGQARCECDMEKPGHDGGAIFSYILTATPFLGLDGKMIGIVESVKDITPRKAVERALSEANEILARQAAIDGLTGVANRRRFDELLDLEWRRMMREENPLSLIMCDIDHFKAYNDTYGHLTGDACLKQVATAIRSALHRPGDLVARYGGEEFVVLLPNTPVEGAMHLAESIQQAISGLNIAHAASAVAPRVTVSLGVATRVPSGGVAPVHLIAIADSALYDAKDQGRNRVVFKDATAS